MESAAIPIELISFDYQIKDKNNVILQWHTISEKNNYGYEIVRKDQKNSPTKIGFVEGAGTTNMPQSYKFIDENLTAGSYVYILNQTDFDGTVHTVGELNLEILKSNNFSLSQNYPNPFNPATTISFNLPKPTAVTLKIFNLTGQEIVTLVNRNLEAGDHHIEWNATNIPTRIYLYKMRAGNFTAAKKLIVQK